MELRTALFSDLHGNALALERLLAERLFTISLGDVLGNVDSNSRCLELMRTHGVPSVKGNHEVDLWNHYQSALTEVDKDQVSRWPAQLVDQDALLGHAFLRNLGGGGFVFTRLRTAVDAQAMFDSSDFRLAFVGHSHQPGWWEMGAGYSPRWHSALVNGRLDWVSGCRYVIDVGSLGEPMRPDDPTWVLWDERGVTWRSTP